MIIKNASRDTCFEMVNINMFLNRHLIDSAKPDFTIKNQRNVKLCDVKHYKNKNSIPCIVYNKCVYGVF